MKKLMLIFLLIVGVSCRPHIKVGIVTNVQFVKGNCPVKTQSVGIIMMPKSGGGYHYVPTPPPPPPKPQCTPDKWRVHYRDVNDSLPPDYCDYETEPTWSVGDTLRFK